MPVNLFYKDFTKKCPEDVRPQIIWSKEWKLASVGTWILRINERVWIGRSKNKLIVLIILFVMCWLTLESSSCLCNGHSMTFLCVIFGPIQGSFQKLICWPVAICQTTPFWQNFQPNWIAFQMLEVWLWWVEYLVSSREAYNEPGDFKSHHAKFPSRALFLVFKFWMYRPPWHFDCWTSDHLIRWIFFLCWVVP